MIYLLYTGGTFGMDHQDPANPNSPLSAQPFSQLLPKMPLFTFVQTIHKHDRELKVFDYKTLKIHCDSLTKPVDSSDVTPHLWQEIANIIAKVYHDYVGFVIIHGTDTMAYSASALSFMLDGLDKPVIFTGSNVPLLGDKSDALANLKLAITSATSPEYTNNVWIAFNNQITLGNSSTKLGSDAGFTDFKRPHRFTKKVFVNEKFSALTNIEPSVTPIFVTPSLSSQAIRDILRSDNCHSFIFMTYGCGNYPTSEDYSAPIKEALDAGKIIANISQTSTGKAVKSLYQSSFSRLDDRILTLQHMTIETASAKLMWAKANLPADEIKNFMEEDQKGELA
ncbi:MAG: asparaginase [SAR324 cluster bacterium]|nr:asparaginase [SAR324 cluster bacterium]